jgi:hypothetical protein
MSKQVASRPIARSPRRGLKYRDFRLALTTKLCVQARMRQCEGLAQAKFYTAAAPDHRQSNNRKGEQRQARRKWYGGHDDFCGPKTPTNLTITIPKVIKTEIPVTILIHILGIHHCGEGLCKV